MKTHKVKYSGYDYYYNCPDGSFRTYCGITEDCSEDLWENGIVPEHEECTCKICNTAYERKLEKDLKEL